MPTVLFRLTNTVSKGENAPTAMLQNLNKWTASLDQGKNVDIIYFDFTKAFDKVPHFELTQKLSFVGLHHRIVAWIGAFLENRTFSVRVNRSFSKPRVITSGVPQGGVLSPILFNIYTYELANILGADGVEFSAFADDIKIFRTVESDDHFLALQRSIDILQAWSTNWKLPISKVKTKVLHLGSTNPKHHYYLDGSPIEAVEEMRDLGFLVTKNLDFDKHCEAIAIKGNMMVSKLFRALSTKKPEALICAYKSYVRPLLEYGTPVFSPYKRASIEKLEKVQNNFTRKLMIRMLGFLYDQIPSSSERNVNLGLEKLSTRRKANDIILFHKIFFGKCAVRLEDFFSVRESSTRGGLRKVRVSTARSNCRRYFFVNRTLPLFEKLLRNSSQHVSINSLRKHINHFLPE